LRNVPQVGPVCQIEPLVIDDGKVCDDAIL